MSDGEWKFQCGMRGSNNCWRDKHVLKFSPFAGIFPRGINFGDVDGLVEYMGEFLMMEWKTDQALWDAIDGTGQDLMHERLVDSGPFTVLQVVGHAGSTEPHMYRIWSHLGGTRSGWYDCNRASFIAMLQQWRRKVEMRNEPTLENQHG